MRTNFIATYIRSNFPKRHQNATALHCIVPSIHSSCRFARAVNFYMLSICCAQKSTNNIFESRNVQFVRTLNIPCGCSTFNCAVGCNQEHIHNLCKNTLLIITICNAGTRAGYCQMPQLVAGQAAAARRVWSVLSFI